MLPLSRIQQLDAPETFPHSWNHSQLFWNVSYLFPTSLEGWNVLCSESWEIYLLCGVRLSSNTWRVESSYCCRCNLIYSDGFCLFFLLVYGVCSTLIPPKQCFDALMNYETKPIKIYTMTTIFTARNSQKYGLIFIKSHSCSKWQRLMAEYLV